MRGFSPFFPLPEMHCQDPCDSGYLKSRKSRGPRTPRTDPIEAGPSSPSTIPSYSLTPRVPARDVLGVEQFGTLFGALRLGTKLASAVGATLAVNAARDASE